MILFQLKLIYNALSADKIKDDLKEIKRDIETIIEKLKNQVTSGEEGIDLIYHKIRKYCKVKLCRTAWTCDLPKLEIPGSIICWG